MIRRVAFKKAIIAGALGATAWEIVVRLLIWVGLPMFDLVYLLGSMLLWHKASVLEWWAIGMLLHAAVGAIWAIFYAYFFWSLFDYPPNLQGIIFSLLPTLLAGSIMVPQMDLMNARILAGELPKNGFFALGIGWGGAAAIVLGHLIYGAVLGFLYKNPVGYPVGQKTRLKYG